MQKITGIFIISFVALAIGYDFWAFYQGGTEATISYWVYDRSHMYPTIPFAIGYLCGHFFWQMKKKRDDK